jgi:hypothetical protein
MSVQHTMPTFDIIVGSYSLAKNTPRFWFPQFTFNNDKLNILLFCEYHILRPTSDEELGQKREGGW